jgi:AAA15 family ATPase/GTPase
MIHKLILRKFKRFDDEIFLFNNFDLIVGTNNSGKSTILQALAIWQFCVEQFRTYKKKGEKRGIQIPIQSFTALPVPEFNLLWRDKTDRRYDSDKKLQVYIPIEIDIYWNNETGEERHFCVELSYGAPGTLYARPRDGWSAFNTITKEAMPHIIYVPPFSGLEPTEKYLADANIRENVGKAQPGSVLRNLLYRVISKDTGSNVENSDWREIKERIAEWFDVELQEIKFDPDFHPKITVNYKEPTSKKSFDIISGGSGFHQILTLLAFMYGWKQTTTILFDEPDAHLHVNLQRQMLDYLKRNSQIQFLIATHSEVFIEKVEIDSILSILSGKQLRVSSGSEIVLALEIIDNIDVVKTQGSPYILYLEGEDDNRILSAWANTMGKSEIYQRFYPYFLRGSTKKDMMQKADRHYEALKKFVPELKRAILLDYDNDEVAINPPSDQPFCNEWKRKNIDNYLLVPDAWKRAVEKKGDFKGLFLQPYNNVIDSFFAKLGLALTEGSTWKNIQTPGFLSSDGKKYLFKNQDSLFEQIKNANNAQLIINRTEVAEAMTQEEIHDDIVLFFDNLKKIVEIDNE